MAILMKRFVPASYLSLLPNNSYLKCMSYLTTSCFTSSYHQPVLKSKIFRTSTLSRIRGCRPVQVIILRAPGGEIKVRDTVVLYIPNIKFRIRQEGRLSNSNRHPGSVAVTAGRNDLAKVLYGIAQLLALRVWLRLPD